MSGVSNTLLALGSVALVVAGIELNRFIPSGQGKSGRWPLYSRRLLNDREQILYQRLVATFPDHIVRAQVALSQLLGIKKGEKDRQALGNRFRQLTADFVICYRAFKPLAVLSSKGFRMKTRAVQAPTRLRPMRFSPQGSSFCR
jgi:hypothetical protein